jgi:hypothetical protein
MLQFYCYNLNILLYKEFIYYNQVNYVHFKKLYMRQRKRIKNYILDIKKKRMRSFQVNIIILRLIDWEWLNMTISVFVVEIEVKYNLITHKKTNFFIMFFFFIINLMYKPQL